MLREYELLSENPQILKLSDEEVLEIVEQYKKYKQLTKKKSPGRPKIIFPWEVVEKLVKEGYGWRAIGRQTNISHTTILREYRKKYKDVQKKIRKKEVKELKPIDSNV